MNKIKIFLPWILGFLIILMVLLRFVWGWCNVWICLGTLGLVIAWQILSDFTNDSEKI